MIEAEIDTTYQTQQRDLFASGLAAQVGPPALAVWLAIKAHADFATGEAWPGVRKLMQDTGMASATVQKAVAALLEHKLLRVARVEGQKHIYIARERMSVRVGRRIICSIVIDYVPLAMRQRLEAIKADVQAGALDGADVDADVWADVEVVPGEGLEWDASTRSLRGRLRADEVPLPDHSDEAPQALATRRKRARITR